MTTRFDIEDALESKHCTLPPISVSIIMWLCTRMDQGTTYIPPKFSPSLTRLAQMTKHHRRTVMRHLIVLEQAGWLKRKPPEPGKARSEHVTTHYTVTIPGYPQAEKLGAGNPLTRGSKPPELGAGDTEARGRVPHKPDLPDPSPDQGAGLGIVVEEIEKRTGQRVSPEWAAKVRDQLAAEPGVRHPAKYVLHRLRTDPDPRRFLPTDQPPAMTPGWERGPT